MGLLQKMFARPDQPRPHYEALRAVLGTLSRDDFDARCAARDQAFRDQGITFSLSGEDPLRYTAGCT